MINSLDIYYSKKIGKGLKPISNNNKQTISTKGDGLKPISKGKGCKKNKWERTKNFTINLIFVNII